VNLLWAVPVVCAAVAMALVAAWARTLEDASRDLVVAVRRTAEIRTPLAGLQRELRRSGPLADRVWSHWDDGSDDDGSDDDGEAPGGTSAGAEEGAAEGPATGNGVPSRRENPGDARH
jgi:hypothetical protein